MSRHLEDLYYVVEDKARDWLSLCKADGLKILITSTLRTNAEQDALLKKVPKVTNAKGGHSYHNYGLAIDFAPLVDGKCAWNRIDLFERAAKIAKTLGFEWGGDWANFKDYPHIQMTFGLSISDLLNGKRPPKSHWADGCHKFLLDNYLESLEKRYDDPITRAEVFSLLTRVLKKMEVTR